MANNRILIICPLCAKRLSIAKFYPNTGWYSLVTTDNLDEFFQDHKHENGERSMWGISPMYLFDYETIAEEIPSHVISS